MIKLMFLGFIVFSCLFLSTSSSEHKFLTKHVIQLEAGNHILTPKDYLYNWQIIVEMWGAGAAGNLCNGYGGNSGGYLKFILTTYLQNINISVGIGGMGTENNGDICRTLPPYNKYKVDYPNNGTDTIFITNNITIVASGGKWNESIPSNSSNYVHGENISIITNIESQPGKLLGSNFVPINNGIGENCECSIPYVYNSYRGGNIYGGSGGDPFSFVLNRMTYASNGQTPGGGGGGAGWLPPYVKPNGDSSGGYPLCYDYRNTKMGTNGGNGRVIIYLNQII